MASLVVTCLLVAGAAGCGSGDDGASDDEPEVANPPDRELRALLGDQGALRHRLSPEDSERFTTVILTVRGLDARERACAAPSVQAVLQPDPEGRVSISRFARLVRRLADPEADLAKAVDACLSEATRQRIEEQRPADDLDLTGFVELAHRVASGQALALGMTEEEATCYADRSLEGVDAEQFARAMVGYADSQGGDPLGAIGECFDRKRLSELVAAGRKLKREYEECLRERTDLQVDALNEALATSSTSVPTGPTTTLAPCV